MQPIEENEEEKFDSHHPKPPSKILRGKFRDKITKTESAKLEEFIER